MITISYFIDANKSNGSNINQCTKFNRYGFLAFCINIYTHYSLSWHTREIRFHCDYIGLNRAQERPSTKSNRYAKTHTRCPCFFFLLLAIYSYLFFFFSFRILIESKIKTSTNSIHCDFQFHFLSIRFDVFFFCRPQFCFFFHWILVAAVWLLQQSFELCVLNLYFFFILNSNVAHSSQRRKKVLRVRKKRFPQLSFTVANFTHNIFDSDEPESICSNWLNWWLRFGCLHQFYTHHLLYASNYL